MRNDKIIIVDENDNIIGLGQKTEVHLTGKLHRAFSTIVINNRGEMLLQKGQTVSIIQVGYGLIHFVVIF